MIDVNQDFWLMSGITGIVAAQYFWINDRYGSKIPVQSPARERQLSVHTGSSPWHDECPVWNPFKTFSDG